jgi:hypothetical protein
MTDILPNVAAVTNQSVRLPCGASTLLPRPGWLRRAAKQDVVHTQRERTLIHLSFSLSSMITDNRLHEGTRSPCTDVNCFFRVEATNIL